VFLLWLGHTILLLGDPVGGARLVAAGVAARASTGSPFPPCDQVDLDRAVDGLREALGAEAFAAAWAAGRAMTLEQAATAAGVSAS
jgi:hypothetical protein